MATLEIGQNFESGMNVAEQPSMLALGAIAVEPRGMTWQKIDEQFATHRIWFDEDGMTIYDGQKVQGISHMPRVDDLYA